MFKVLFIREQSLLKLIIFSFIYLNYSLKRFQLLIYYKIEIKNKLINMICQLNQRNYKFVILRFNKLILTKKMKQKCKQLPIVYNSVQNQNDYINYLSINKKPQQYVRQKSHLPLSNKNINVRKSQQSKIYKQNIKQDQIHYIRQSPYSNLPSLPNENNQEMNQSNESQKYYSIQNNQNQNKYKCNKYDSNKYDQNNSIYEKLRLSSNRKEQFQTQQSQQVNYYSKKCINNDCDRNIIKKQNSCNINKNKQSNLNQSKSSNQNNKKQIINNNNHVNQKPNFNKKQNHQSQYYFTPNNIHQKQQNQSTNYYSLLDKQKSQQLVKKHINDKLDRVCQKINHLSKQKQYQLSHKHKSITKQNNPYHANINTNNKINWNHQNNNLKQYSSTKTSSKLCYSNIVYEQNKQISRTPSSNLLTYQQQSQRINNEQKQKDNRIQQRIISLPKPTHTQFLQTRVIEMDKKISLANQKIVKLQQQLLKERQKLIRKQKQWLLRQNQLLQWIDENQIDQQIIEPSNNNPKIIKNQQNLNISSNNIILNNKNQYYLLQQQLSIYHQTYDNLHTLLNNILNVFKSNQNWLILMNRTLSEELPGTAFRVKQQMNFKKINFKSLENQCINQIIEISHIQPKHKPTTNFKQQNYQHIQTPIISNNQSQVFLLQSYCPPTSQRYEISTKRNSSNLKHSSRKSLLCVSQSKSTTNKKNNQNISTHKKPNYSKQKDKKQSQFIKPQKQLNRSLYNSRKSQYYCDQVFYDKAPTLQQQIHMQTPNTQLSSDELYYLLSLQAMALQKFISPNLLNKQLVQQDQNFQQEESQLLDSST